SPDGTPRTANGNSTLPSAVSQGNRLLSWVTKPTAVLSPSTGAPLHETTPADVETRPEASLRSVVLPQPDGPTTLVIFPGSTSKLTRSSARTSRSCPAKATWTSEKRMAGSAAACSTARITDARASLRCAAIQVGPGLLTRGPRRSLWT